MKQYRLNRLFNGVSNRCFDVAIDHGFFNEISFLGGIERMEEAVRVIVEAGPDAIQLSVGQLRYLQAVPGKAKPALVLRVDTANVYGPELTGHSFSKMIAEPVLQAVRADAACMCVNLFSIPGAPEVTAQCIDNIMALKIVSDHYSMPMMIEPLVFRPNSEKGGYQVDGDLQKILPLVRQAVELGADIIKADPADDIDEYHRVITIAGRVPVLVRGGGRASDQEILLRTEKLLQQGIAGIVYGRNIIQHPHPSLMTRILMMMVHEGLSAKEGIRMIEEVR